MFARIKASKRANDLIKAFLVVSLIFLATGVSGNFIYDENDEPALESFVRGLYYGSPITHVDFGIKGISGLYASLYARLDWGINYFGLSLILLNYWAFLLLVFFLFNKGPKHVAVGPLLFLLLAFYNIFIVSFTTTAILAHFAGLLLFLYALTELGAARLKFPALFLASATIIFSYLLRPASGILATLLFAPVLAWQLLFGAGKAKKALYLTLLLPLLASIGIERQVAAGTDARHDFDSEAIGAFSKINNFGYAFQPENKLQEKILFEIENWYFFDAETRTIKDHQQRLVPPPKLVQAKPALRFAIVSLLNRRSSAFLCIIVIPLLMIFLFRLKNVQVVIFYLVIGYYFCLLVAIALLMKMPPRVLMPSLLAVIYFVFTTFPKLFKSLKRETSGIFLKAMACVVILLAAYQTWSLARDLGRENQKAETSWVELKGYLDSEKPEYVFLTWAYDINYYPLKHVRWDPGVKMAPLVGWMSYHPQAYEFLRSLTGSCDVPGIVQWIAANRDKAAVYSDEENNTVLERIFAYHGLQARLLPNKILNEESGKGFYRIEFSTASKLGRDS